MHEQSYTEMISVAARKLIFKSICFCIFTVTVACLVGLITNNLGFGFFFAFLTLFSVAMLYMVIKWKCIGNVASTDGGDDGFCWSTKESKSMADYYHYYHYNEELLEHRNNNLTTNINNNDDSNDGERNTPFIHLRLTSCNENTSHHHHYHCRLHHHHIHASTRTMETINDPMLTTSDDNSASTGHLLSMHSTNASTSSSSDGQNLPQSLESLLRKEPCRPLHARVMSDTDLFTRIETSVQPPPYSIYDINNIHRNMRVQQRERMDRRSLVLPSYQQVEVEHLQMISRSTSAVQHPSLLMNCKLFYYVRLTVFSIHILIVIAVTRHFIFSEYLKSNFYYVDYFFSVSITLSVINKFNDFFL